MLNPKAGILQVPSPISQKGRLAESKSLAETDLLSRISEEAIRIHAYELYERRGRSHGYAVEDWLTAEAHLMARKNHANKKLFR
jgi:DUF2934 family protein